MVKYNAHLLEESKKELGFKEHIADPEELLKELWACSENRLQSLDPPKLTLHPSPERHPYADILPIDPSFNKYIIGTFPPITYQADRFPNIIYQNGKKVSQPQLPFYHGNRQMLWKYLIPKDQYDSLSTTRQERRQQIVGFLKSHRINYADIIDYCQRADYNADDANLFNIILNKRLIETAIHSSNQNILMVFNTGSLFTKRGMSFVRGIFQPREYVFDMFVYLMIQSGFSAEIQVGDRDPIAVTQRNADILGSLNNILAFNLLLNGNLIHVVAGPSPANGDGMLQANQIYKRFIKRYDPMNSLSLGESKAKFKTHVYQTALLGNYQELNELNTD